MLIHTLFGFILSHYINIPMHVDVYPYFSYLVGYIQKLYSIYMPSNIVRVTYKGNCMYIAWHTMSFSHTLIFGLFYCRVWPPTTGRWHIMNNSDSNVFCLLLVRPLSMSSNAFVNGARMSGICAFIAGYFEYEQKTLLIHRPATLIFRTHLCGIVCITIKQPTQWLNVMPILFLTSTSWHMHVYMINNNIHRAENLSGMRVCP